MVRLSVRRTGVAVAMLLALGTAQRAQAQLVSNGGFETGTFASWTTAGTGIAIDNAMANSGIYDATFTSLSTDTTPGTLSQLVSTVPAQGYTLSFWLLDQNVLPGADAMNVSFGGFNLSVLGSSLNMSAYTNVVLSVPGTDITSGTTTLSFQGLLDPSGGTLPLNLDDVILTANSGPNVPEPSTLALLAGGLLMLTRLRRRR
jgi:hypothetical protein